LLHFVQHTIFVIGFASVWCVWCIFFFSKKMLKVGVFCVGSVKFGVFERKMVV
jgi:hypothetical protein